MLVLAPKLRVPYPIILVLGGLALGFVPGLPEIDLPPDLVLVGVLPLLLYGAAFFTSLRDLRANLRPVGLLAVGLVLLTMVVVAVVAHEIVPGLPWAAAFVLGAVVSPTDPIAATAIMHRLGVPRRIVSIVEGESLVNDGTALVAYRVAVVATVSGTFSLWDAQTVVRAQRPRRRGGRPRRRVDRAPGAAAARLPARRGDDFPAHRVFRLHPCRADRRLGGDRGGDRRDLYGLVHTRADDARGAADGRVGVGDRHVHAERDPLHADRLAAARDPRRPRRLLRDRPALVGGGDLAHRARRPRPLGLPGGKAAAAADPEGPRTRPDAASIGVGADHMVRDARRRLPRGGAGDPAQHRRRARHSPVAISSSSSRSRSSSAPSSSRA